MTMRWFENYSRIKTHYLNEGLFYYEPDLITPSPTTEYLKRRTQETPAIINFVRKKKKKITKALLIIH